MGRFIDITNQKFGYLTALYRLPSEKGKPIKWHCKCDCGNEVDVYGTMLRNGNTKSCGCYQRQRARESNIQRGGGDLVGQKYGRLIVIKEVPSKSKGEKKNRYFLCKCECGNQIEVSANHLRSGHTKSCGCLTKENTSKATVIREEGNRYGKLTVIEEYGRDKDQRILWRCRCDCGNEKIALGKSLRAELVQSCGCMHSKGEEKIASILQNNNIDFIRQFHTEKLKSNKGYFLYFDFFLPSLNIIIEYQGEQHYHPTRWYKNQDSFEEVIERDNLKREYCIENNIKLIEIPYSDYDKLDFNYLEVVLNE